MTKLTRLTWFSFASLAVALTPALAQTKSGGSTKAEGGGQSQVERGRYIVENVAMCELCHTPRDEKGEPIKSKWLKGGPTQLRASYPSARWAVVEPKIGGGPPGSDSDFIRLLTTGISRNGNTLAPPMPPFRMTRSDAEAVLAYLKSLPQ
jgi:mono/diheme cytochrome c family protein